MALFDEPEIREISPLPRPRPRLPAVTRHADVVEVSRHPEIYCSGQRRTIFDMPPEILEFFGGMINMDDPRHARLRRIVSAAFNPPHHAASRTTSSRWPTASSTGRGPGRVRLRHRGGGPAPPQDHLRHDGRARDRVRHCLRCSNIILAIGDPEYVPEGTDPVLPS